MKLYSITILPFSIDIAGCHISHRYFDSSSTNVSNNRSDDWIALKCTITVRTALREALKWNHYVISYTRLSLWSFHSHNKAPSSQYDITFTTFWLLLLNTFCLYSKWPITIVLLNKLISLEHREKKQKLPFQSEHQKVNWTNLAAFWKGRFYFP